METYDFKLDLVISTEDKTTEHNIGGKWTITLGEDSTNEATLKETAKALTEYIKNNIKEEDLLKLLTVNILKEKVKKELDMLLEDDAEFDELIDEINYG